jgi:hypothetical protein
VQALAILAICMYPVGLLIITGALLFHERRAIRARRSTLLSESIRFLYDEYEPWAFWWELLEMVRRLVLVGVMVLVSRGSVTQLVIATVLCAVYLLLQTEASPFEDLGDNFLASSCSFALVVFFVCIIMFKLATLTDLRELQEHMSVRRS